MVDCSDNHEITAELLASREYEFSTWEDREQNITVHTVFTDSKENARDLSVQLRLLADSWRNLGVRIAEISPAVIPDVDWNEMWKRHFTILEISPRLVVRPSWLEYDSSPGQVIIELDPGMSFGTGHHATTAFCLEMIDTLADNQEVNSLLDAGCGSGILSIAASKLGFHPIAAFDYDPDAVTAAGENLEKNDLTEKEIELFQADLGELLLGDRRFDLIAANILAPVLKANRDILLEYLQPGGYLILAGILTTEYPEIRDYFTATGCTEVNSRSEKEWTGGMFRKLAE